MLSSLGSRYFIVKGNFHIYWMINCIQQIKQYQIQIQNRIITKYQNNKMSRVSTDQDQFQQVDFSTSPTALGQQKKSSNGWIIIVVIVLSIICAYYFFDKTFQVKSNVKQSQPVEALGERQAQNSTKTGSQNQNKDQNQKQQQISSNNKSKQVEESEDNELSLQQKLKLIEQKVIRDEQKYKKQSAEVKTIEQQQIEQQIKLEDEETNKQLQDYQQQREKIQKQLKQKEKQTAEKPFYQPQATVNQQINKAEAEENFMQKAEQNKQSSVNQQSLLLRQNLQQSKQKTKQVENQNKQNSVLGWLESKILANKTQSTGFISGNNTNSKTTTSNQGQVSNPYTKTMQNGPSTTKTQSQEQQTINELQTETSGKPNIISTQITDTSATGEQISKPQTSLQPQPQKFLQIENKQQSENAPTFFSQKQPTKQKQDLNRAQKVQIQQQIKQASKSQPSLKKQQGKTEDSASQTKQNQIKQKNKQQTQKFYKNQPSDKNSNIRTGDEQEQEQEQEQQQQQEQNQEQKQEQKQQKPQHSIIEDDQTKIQPKSVDKIQKIEPQNEGSANIEGKQKEEKKLDAFSQQFKDMIEKDYQLGNESDKQILARLELIKGKAKNKNKSKNISITDKNQTININQVPQKTKTLGKQYSQQKQKQEDQLIIQQNQQNKDNQIIQPAENVQIIKSRKNPSHRTPKSILEGQQADQNTKKQGSYTNDKKLSKDQQAKPAALDFQQSHIVNNDDNFVLSQTGDQKVSDPKIKEPQIDNNKLVSLTDLKQATSAENKGNTNKKIQQQTQSIKSQGFIQTKDLKLNKQQQKILNNSKQTQGALFTKSNENKATIGESLPAIEQMDKNNLRTQQGVQSNQGSSSAQVSKTLQPNTQKRPRDIIPNPSKPTDLSSNAFTQSAQATEIPTAAVSANNQKQAFPTTQQTPSQQNGKQSQDMQLLQLAKQLKNMMNKNGQQSQGDDMLMGVLQKLKNKMSKQPQTNNISNDTIPNSNNNTVNSVNSRISSNSTNSTNNTEGNNLSASNATNISISNNDNKIAGNPTETDKPAPQGSPWTVSIQDKGTGNADTENGKQNKQQQQQQQQQNENQDNQQKIKDIMAKAALIDPA